MIRTVIKVDNNLSFFLGKKKKSEIKLSFAGQRSVKDLLESLGIPHVEIGRIKIDNRSVMPDTLITRDCRVEAEGFNPGNPVLGSEPPFFILDVHLGKLAVNLRMLGFDADYSNDRDDDELTRLTCSRNTEKRMILLSCDRGLMMRRGITAGMLIRSRDPIEQAAEVLRRYNLCEYTNPFTRCFNCGGLLKSAGGLDDLSEGERGRLPKGVVKWCRSYTRCMGCGQLYWEGSHFERLYEKVKLIMQRCSSEIS